MLLIYRWYNNTCNYLISIETDFVSFHNDLKRLLSGFYIPPLIQSLLAKKSHKSILPRYLFICYILDAFISPPTDLLTRYGIHIPSLHHHHIRLLYCVNNMLEAFALLKDEDYLMIS